jgi:hypothetical protein
MKLADHQERTRELTSLDGNPLESVDELKQALEVFLNPLFHVDIENMAKCYHVIFPVYDENDNLKEWKITDWPEVTTLLTRGKLLALSTVNNPAAQQMVCNMFTPTSDNDTIERLPNAAIALGMAINVRKLRTILHYHDCLCAEAVSDEQEVLHEHIGAVMKKYFINYWWDT